VEIKPTEWADVAPPPVVARSIRQTPPAAPPVEEDSLPSIGVTVHTLSHALAEHYGLDVTTDGVVVVAVEKGTAAARKGIKPGDVITTVNKQSVSTLKDFQDALRAADFKMGISVRLLSGKKNRFEILKEGE
jgi:serine protease Do